MYGLQRYILPKNQKENHASNSMRGAFYVTTALLVTNSIRTAAEADQPGHRPTSNHDGVVPGRMDTESSPRRYFQGSRNQHEDSALSVADEERMPEPSTEIMTSLSEEALYHIRKAAHMTFDLNAPPEETPTGALAAYNNLRNKDPRTYIASGIETPSGNPSKKRTAQALTSLDKAPSSAIPKKRAIFRQRKPRINVPRGATEVQSSISDGKMTPTSGTSIDDYVNKIHNLFLEHLQQNSAKYEPTKYETMSFLGLVNRKKDSRPSMSFTYVRYIEKLMKMDLEDLKKLVIDSPPDLEKSLEDMLKLSLEDHKEIQLRLLRLLRLKRWVRMYRDFFNFCLSNHNLFSNYDAQTTLGLELKLLMENAKPSANLDTTSASLPTEKITLTNAERKMFGSVVDAVEKANLSENDKNAWYKIVDEIYRDDDKLTPPDLSAFIADASDGKRPTALSTKVLKGPLKFDSNDWPSRRQKISEFLEEATIPAKQTNNYYWNFFVEEGEDDKVTAIREAFLESSTLLFKPTLSVTKKMWYMFNWEVKPNPESNVKPGVFLKDHVRRMNRMELEEALGSERVRAVRQSEAGQRDFPLELRTEYLVLLLDAYDKFYKFCDKNRLLCVIPSSAKRRSKIETRSRVKREQLLDRAKKRQKSL